jgi:murein hydrolase activator
MAGAHRRVSGVSQGQRRARTVARIGARLRDLACVALMLVVGSSIAPAQSPPPDPEAASGSLSTDELGALAPTDSNAESPAAATPAPASAAQTDSPTPEEREAQESEVRARLEAVREQQRALAAERDGTRGERTELALALRTDELRVAEIARALHGFDEALAAREADLAQLQYDEREAQQRLDRQRAAIAALLRSAYALGRHDQLRLVFAPEQVRDVARLLSYHRYLERDRRERVTALTRDLAALVAVRTALQRAQEALVRAKTDQAREAEQLVEARDTRQASLAALEAKLADQSQRLAALGKDEKGLVALIDQLRDAIGDVPRQLAGAEPFASQRGRVPWPVKGEVLQRFGVAGADGRAAAGILLAANAGSSVTAVSHGRVAYADWLKGYGLLLILDHGDGYLTLYAHNESLLKDVGDWVDEGEAIATVGSSGGRRETGVWFELRQGGRPLDPSAWLVRR